MRVIVVGCGRLGANLAASLVAENHQVCVIDENSEAFDRLPGDFPGQTALGTGFDEDVLREAGIESCDFVAVMTNGDATNYMVAEAVRQLFRVARVVVRVNDPDLEPVFHDLGLETVDLPALTDVRVRQMLAAGTSGRP